MLSALSQVGYGFAREWTADQILQSPVTIIGDDPRVAIFLVAWSVEYDHALAGAWNVEVEGVRVPVIGLDDLIATKRTGRPLDVQDVEALEVIKRTRAGEM